jgi:hypothetical protein
LSSTFLRTTLPAPIMQFLPIFKDEYKRYVFASKEILSKLNKKEKIYNKNFFAFNENNLNVTIGQNNYSIFYPIFIILM